MYNFNKLNQFNFFNQLLVSFSAGIGGADIAEVEGRIAAVHIAAELGFISDGEHDQREKALFKKRKRIERYVRTFIAALVRTNIGRWVILQSWTISKIPLVDSSGKTFTNGFRHELSHRIVAYSFEENSEEVEGNASASVK